MSNLAIPDSSQKKGFFEKPENYTMILVYIGLGLVGFYFLDAILPMVTRVLDFALEATWKAILLGLMLAFATFLVTSKDWHRVLWLYQQQLMRKFTSWVIELDPIAIMEGYIQTLKKNDEDISSGIADLRGQREKLETRLSRTADDLLKSQRMAVEAQKRAVKGQAGMKSEFLLQSRKAGRLEKSGVTYQGLLARIKAHISLMEKVQEAARFMIADISDTVEVEKDKREMIHASFKAMKGARRILASNDQRELYDMALEANQRDYENKLGEIEQFMHDSKHFINTMDLENGVYEAEALSKLEEWEQRSQKLMGGGTGKTTFQLPSPAIHNFKVIDTEIEQRLEVNPTDNFDDLFNKL